MASFAPEEHREEVFLAAAGVSRGVREGHICLFLNEAAGRMLSPVEGDSSVVFPPLERWIQALKNSPCVGRPGDFCPLVLDEKNRLYLHRYWEYENAVARHFAGRMTKNRIIRFDESSVREKLNRYFGDDGDDQPDWQKVAAAAALMKKFLIITGSPGTGKTTTLAKILALIQETAEIPLRIALAAPTGKAAARLQETVGREKASLPCPEAIRESLPNEAQTLHRLLGSISRSPSFRFNEKNRLPYDLVVVDEASMVDLPLMAKLTAALSDNASLILLGDKDQLASVEVGIVLGDLCDLAAPNVFSADFARTVFRLSGQRVAEADLPDGIQNHIIHLQKNYRFGADSGIHALSRAVRDGKSDETVHLLRRCSFSDVVWVNPAEENQWLPKLAAAVLKGYESYWRSVRFGSSDIHAVFDAFETFRVLCALRVGHWGTEKINSLMENVFYKAGWLTAREVFYAGMPVMILQNDYRLRLFNGDVGIVLKDAEQNNQLMVFFRDEKGLVRKFFPSRLPQFETAWAMTVHKSQGSEFRKVLLLLGDADAPLLTRELIYTAITRARQCVEIWAEEALLNRAVSRKISRQSGLADALSSSGKPSVTP